ncbi:hypothetical protein HanXRQr2_Chr10g0443421 [Helianthus annuus]|uniref:Secreted protein n=1 Tax=Helianthus annuus TaxID=4232 RepID=A0A9K3HY93_HELAN|nr:hypothetical protein HanXRQr2_Chr10g0443421 [Helianthus annuus]KAJ0530150.1 hypothetical protein HanHA89_Chr10g0386351 [Helianthus annuus]
MMIFSDLSRFVLCWSCCWSCCGHDIGDGCVNGRYEKVAEMLMLVELQVVAAGGKW